MTVDLDVAAPGTLGLFTAADDGLHTPSDSFYDNETFWFSFWIPERKIGAWVYAAVRQHPGITAGGMWIWDDTSAQPHDAPFYEQYAHLRAPSTRGPAEMAFPTGLTVTVREPLMSYDVVYDDRDRVRAELRFDALEAPVPLLVGAPPYPRAAHFDQTGRVTGTVTLDGEQIAVDCCAMRDRSWGPRTERGYHRVGYAWAASPEVSFLSFTTPTATTDDIYTGYLRRDGVVSKVVSGERRVQRHPEEGWLTSLDVTATDELGRTFTGHGEALSRIVLPNATTICVATALEWTIDGQTVVGEDQDVWPIKEWRTR